MSLGDILKSLLGNTNIADKLSLHLHLYLYIVACGLPFRKEEKTTPRISINMIFMFLVQNLLQATFR